MKKKRMLVGGAVVILGAANPLMAQQPPGFQAPGIIPGRPYKVEPVKGVEGVPPVPPAQVAGAMPGLEEPNLSLLERTRLLLYRIGIIKESPIQTAPGSMTRAPKAP
jgi:hypothetical protein